MLIATTMIAWFVMTMSCEGFSQLTWGGVLVGLEDGVDNRVDNEVDDEQSVVELRF